MRKKHSPTRINDQVCPTGYDATRKPPRPFAKDFYADPAPSKPRRTASYISGQAPKNEPDEIPRLFIRGLGGSLKLDLRGLGIGLSPSAFAHWVSDESLKGLHVHSGDIAVVDPMRRILKAGNLVLLEIECRSVIRRIIKRRRLWYVAQVDDTASKPILLLDQSLHGVVIGFLRLFVKAKPVRYRQPDAYLTPSPERTGFGKSRAPRPSGDLTNSALSTARSTKHKRTSLALAAEDPSRFYPTEINGKKPQPG